MNHIPRPVQVLGVILVVAGLTPLPFKRLRQPVVLGYILAGLLVGPLFSLFPAVILKYIGASCHYRNFPE